VSIRGDQRVEATGARPSLARASVWLVLAKGVQLATGFAFWVVAARVADVRDVGVAAASVAAVLACTQVALFGTGSAVITRLGAGHAVGPALNTAWTLVSVTGALAAVGYLVAFGPGTTAPNPGWLAGFSALFLFSVVTGTLVIVFDQTSIALGRSQDVLVRYGFGAVACLASLAVVAVAGTRLDARAVLAVWSLTSGVAAGTALAQLFWFDGYRPRLSLDWSRHVELLRVGVPNQVLTLTERIPPLLVPILLARVAGPEQAAYWYPAWMMVWGLFTVPVAVGLVQFADGVREPTQLRATVLRGWRFALMTAVPGCLLLAIVAPYALRAVGPAYADASTIGLRVLLIGLPGYLVLQAWNAVSRAVGRVAEAAAAGALLTVATAVATVVAGPHGITTMAWSWVGCLTVTAGWAAVRLPSYLARAEEVGRP